MPKRKTKAEKQLDNDIERFYYKNGNGVQIDIMSIPKIYDRARAAHAAGEDVEQNVIASIAEFRRN
jgi:hypothetical protein